MRRMFREALRECVARQDSRDSPSPENSGAVKGRALLEKKYLAELPGSCVPLDPATGPKPKFKSSNTAKHQPQGERNIRVCVLVRLLKLSD